ncbi:unnamed protein product, partial [Scytosiphon promiscuus]
AGDEGATIGIGYVDRAFRAARDISVARDLRHGSSSRAQQQKHRRLKNATITPGIIS